MNAVSRSLWAGVCLLAVLLPGLDASAQFLDQKLIQAKQIDAAMRQQIVAYVDPQIKRLVEGEPQDIAEGRKKLYDQLNNPNATPAFVDALSETITARLDPAVNHDDVPVRMNAQIILSQMTDEKSKALIDQGLLDKNVAVQRLAMEALAGRVKTWKDREAAGNGPANFRQKLAGVVTQVNAKLDADPAPHPIVVTPAFDVFIAVDTAEARAALVEQLNKRIALHAADPNLSYAPEQSAIGAFASQLVIQAPFDQASGTGLSRAAFRYAVLIHDQLKAGAIKDEHINGAKNMLGQCFLALSQMAAGARKQAPANQGNANKWIADGTWNLVQTLLTNDWAIILRAAPFSLGNEELGLD